MRKEEARMQLQLFFYNSVKDFNLKGKTDGELKRVFKTVIKNTLSKTKQNYSQLSRKKIHEAEQEVKTYQYNKGALDTMLEVFDEEFDKFIKRYHPDLKNMIVDMRQKSRMLNKGEEIGE